MCRTLFGYFPCAASSANASLFVECNTKYHSSVKYERKKYVPLFPLTRTSLHTSYTFAFLLTILRGLSQAEDRD